MNIAVAIRMYKGKHQIYDGTQCVDEAEPTKLQEWFHELCVTTMGDDIDDVIRVKHRDVITLDVKRELYNLEMTSAYTLENGIRYTMLGYVKFYDEES